MKKQIGIVLTVLTVAALVGVFSIPTGTSSETVDQKLAPYQAVIGKLNRELGSSIYIPAGTEEKVYNNIKNKSPREFEMDMRKEYADFLEQWNHDPFRSNQGWEKSEGNGKLSGAVPLPNARDNVVPTPLK